MQQVSTYPLAFPCVFWKFEVGERFGLKNGGGGTAFPHTLTTEYDHTNMPPGLGCLSVCPVWDRYSRTKKV